MPVRAPPGGTERVQHALAVAASPAVRRAILLQCGAQVLKFLRDEFRASTDPYGAAWASLRRARHGRRHRGGQAKVLLDTGRMRNSFTVAVAGARLRVGSNVGYAAFHQGGTDRMVARRMLPTAARGLPAAWKVKFMAIARRAMKQALARG